MAREKAKASASQERQERQDTKAEHSRSLLKSDGTIAFSVVAGTAGLGIALLENEKAAASESLGGQPPSDHDASGDHARGAVSAPLVEHRFPQEIGLGNQQAETVIIGNAADINPLAIGDSVDTVSSSEEPVSSVEQASEAPHDSNVSDDMLSAHSSGDSLESDAIAVSQHAVSPASVEPTNIARLQPSAETAAEQPATPAEDIGDQPILTNDDVSANESGSDIVSEVTEPVVDVVSTVTDTVSDVVSAVVEPVVDVVSAVTDTVSDVVSAVVEPVVDVVSAVTDAVSDVVSAAVEPVGDVVSAVTEPVSNVVSAVTDALGGSEASGPQRLDSPDLIVLPEVVSAEEGIGDILDFTDGLLGLIVPMLGVIGQPNFEADEHHDLANSNGSLLHGHI